jgi:hypothetical protein
MRHGYVRIATLAFALGLGAAGLAHGDDPPAKGPGPWYSRIFGGGTPAAKKAPDVKKEDAKPLPPGAVSALKAQAHADYMRRLEVCDKLREIGFESSDDELRRKADQLEQRAFDAYVQQMNRLGGAPPGLDDAIFQDRLGANTDSGKLGTDSSAQRSKSGDGRAAVGGKR